MTEHDIKHNPTPPAEPISPEARAKAAPAEDALRAKLRQIKTREQAHAVIDELFDSAGGRSEKELREERGAAAEPAQAVQEQAAKPGAEGAADTLLEAAAQVAASSGETREALEEAVQRATNVEQRGEVDEELRQPLELLRAEVLARLGPLRKLDTAMFLAINHMPHPHAANMSMYALTTAMNGGWGWVLGLVMATAVEQRHLRALRQILPPLWFATMTVEYPIKRYFRRKRPFIDIVQAISVGRKPGGYSFPSGHSAAAFAGAWLLTRHYPGGAPAWYTVAALVGFSRIYLGAHYPGDVLTGALSGTVIAEAARWLMDHADEGEGRSV